jgi:hypothetical protein
VSEKFSDYDLLRAAINIATSCWQLGFRPEDPEGEDKQLADDVEQLETRPDWTDEVWRSFARLIQPGPRTPVWIENNLRPNPFTGVDPLGTGEIGAELRRIATVLERAAGVQELAMAGPTGGEVAWVAPCPSCGCRLARFAIAGDTQQRKPCPGCGADRCPDSPAPPQSRPSDAPPAPGPAQSSPDEPAAPDGASGPPPARPQGELLQMAARIVEATYRARELARLGNAADLSVMASVYQELDGALDVLRTAYPDWQSRLAAPPSVVEPATDEPLAERVTRAAKRATETATVLLEAEPQHWGPDWATGYQVTVDPGGSVRVEVSGLSADEHGWRCVCGRRPMLRFVAQPPAKLSDPQQTVTGSPAGSKHVSPSLESSPEDAPDPGPGPSPLANYPLAIAVEALITAWDLLANDMPGERLPAAFSPLLLEMERYVFRHTDWQDKLRAQAARLHQIGRPPDEPLPPWRPWCTEQELPPGTLQEWATALRYADTPSTEEHRCLLLEARRMLDEIHRLREVEDRFRILRQGSDPGPLQIISLQPKEPDLELLQAGGDIVVEIEGEGSWFDSAPGPSGWICPCGERHWVSIRIRPRPAPE